nr:MAG TPA: hypothetical protein [Caudoviricetes sp.]
MTASPWGGCRTCWGTRLQSSHGLYRREDQCPNF